MGKIILKGTNIPTIETTDQICKEINQKKLSVVYDENDVIEIEGVVVQMKDIKYAISDPAYEREMYSIKKMDDNEKYYIKQNQEMQKMKDEIYSWNLNKIISVNMFAAKMIKFSIDGKWLEDGHADMIENIITDHTKQIMTFFCDHKIIESKRHEFMLFIKSNYNIKKINDYKIKNLQLLSTIVPFKKWKDLFLRTAFIENDTWQKTVGTCTIKYLESYIASIIE